MNDNAIENSSKLAPDPAKLSPARKTRKKARSAKKAGRATMTQLQKRYVRKS